MLKHKLESIAHLAPFPQGAARETIICDALVELAARHGIEWTAKPSIDAAGEIMLASDRDIGPELAAIFSTIPRRTGIMPYSGPCMPYHRWFRINHFDAERMLLSLEW